jgi:hypothetical protein
MKKERNKRVKRGKRGVRGDQIGGKRIKENEGEEWQ